jgi:pimeloyl-ACP methyl ester carboxylesterase
MPYVSAAGIRTHVFDEGTGTNAVVCIHGNPDSADAWQPLLARSAELGRVLAPDLPGFGRSERPGAFVADVDTFDRWLPALLDELGIERARLVAHDWGGYALAALAQRPELIDRIAGFNVLPLDGGYHWHFVARLLWQRPLIGELSMLTLRPWLLKQLLPRASGTNSYLPDATIDGFFRHIDPGMKRAILQLYRSGTPARLAWAGRRLETVDCPKLMLWGTGDGFVSTRDGRRYAHWLGDCTFEPIHGAGHWPMIEAPWIWDRLTEFLRLDET